MFNDKEIQEISELLNFKKKVVITTHHSPDGDAVGASLGLYNYFINCGIEATVIVPDEYPKFLWWMKGHNEVVDFSKNPKAATDKLLDAAIMFCLDYNQISRMGHVMGSVVQRASGCKIMIDHHRDPEDFTLYCCSDISSSSTAQLIFEFIDILKGGDKIDVNVAECLYAGIVTDSGSFKYSTTSAKTHRIVAALIDCGADGSAVQDRIFDQNTYNRALLWGYAVSSKLVLVANNRAAVLSLSKEDLSRYDYHNGDTEGLVNEPLGIEGVIMSVFIREEKDMVKLSFRSKGEIGVNDIARNDFQGGGHFNAAGGCSTLSLEETIEKVKKVIVAYLK